MSDADGGKRREAQARVDRRFLSVGRSVRTCTWREAIDALPRLPPEATIHVSVTTRAVGLDSVVVVYPDGNRTEDTRELAPAQVLRELGVQLDDACGAELTPPRRALAMLIYAVNDAVFPEQLEADPDSVVMPLPPLDPKEPFVPNLLGLQPVTLPEPEFDLSGLEVGTDDVGDTTRRRRGGK